MPPARTVGCARAGTLSRVGANGTHRNENARDPAILAAVESAPLAVAGP